MRRGRPRHDDILTPREWDVLRLLREGLTNEQIAARLDISLSGAKYHVSEILSKLDVSSREEAARWSGEVRPRPNLIALPLVLLRESMLARVTGGVCAAGIAGFLVLFAIGLAQHRDETPVSALGKVAFLRDGNIWVKSLPSGPEQQVTTGGTARRPSWSASGRWLMYVIGPPAPPDEIGVRIVRADGSDSRSVGALGRPSWAPHDDLIAYTLEDGTLVVEQADGSGRRELLPPIPDRGFNPLDRRVSPLWSSDGQWIVFEEQHADHTRAAAYVYDAIRAVRLDGSGEHELYSAPVSTEGMRTGPMPLPWSSKNSPTLLTLDPTTTTPGDVGGVPLAVRVLPTRDLEAPGLPLVLNNDAVAASPAGPRLAVVAGATLESWPADAGSRPVPPMDAQTNKQIVVIDVASGNKRVLTRDDIVPASPAWSPDGHSIAFVARPDTGPVPLTDSGFAAERERRVWTVGRNGLDAAPLRIEGADCRHEHPQWSSSGSQILFACMTNEYDVSLWLVPSIGGTAIEVVPHVSPALPAITSLIGFRGHIDWDHFYDWWQPAPDRGR